MNRSKTALLIAAAFFPPFLVGLSVHRQGFNLLDDGLWLLGTHVILEGGKLYGDIFSIYGPARYFLLAPFFLVLGQSALTLAVFKAVLDGAASGFGWWYTRRLGAGRWSWLVPVGVVAFGPVHPRYFAAAMFAALVGWLLVRTPSRRRGIFTGLAWAGLSLFGLDMAGYGAVILAGGWFLSRRLAAGRDVGRSLPVGGVVAGLGAVLGLAALICLILGIFPTAFWDTVVYPLTRFGGAMGVSWFDSFLNDPMLRHPFSGQFTGEVLDGMWSGHWQQRMVAFRGMFLLVWVIPLAFLGTMRRSGDPRLGPLLALTLAGWVTLLARGDIFHLRLVWFGTLLAVPVLVARLPGGPRVRSLLAGLFVLVVAFPLAGEKVWLAVNLDRPGLTRWDRASARVYLAPERVETLEAVCSGLPWDGRAPVLVWPVQPGLQFVLGAPLATAQATLLGGEVRSTAAVIAELEESRPSAAILGSAWGLVSGVTDIRGLDPGLWTYLRQNYSRQEEFMTEGESFLTATRVLGVDDPEPDLRLPGVAQQATTGISAALGPGVSVAQSFLVEDFDLGAVELMFRSPGPFPYPISFIVTIYQVGGPGKGRQLLQFPFNVSLVERTKKIRFSFPPIPGTVGRKVLVEIAGHSAGTRPFNLLWNTASPEVPRFVDFYPEGQAYLNKKPLEADLYFVTY